jgi:uncharacterized protein with NRDE domain
MCSIILKISSEGVFIGANRDEMVAREWEMPAEYWPGVIGGRDVLGGGTWMGMNRHGVMAAVLNRTGTLGPAPGKNSRGELPILALRHETAQAAADALKGVDAGTYRSFNLVIADANGAFLLRGLEAGEPDVSRLPEGVTMITAGESNDVSRPRIAKHLPRFEAAAFSDWRKLLGDRTGDWESAVNIPERDGFATVSSSLISLPRESEPEWDFASGAPDKVEFIPVPLKFQQRDLAKG